MNININTDTLPLEESCYRYPGARPFYDTDVDRRLFYGRNKDAQLLLHQTLTGSLVVLYAKSGLGKTSLINAGLNQELRNRDFIPLPIRFNNTKIEPLKTVYSQIKEMVVQKNLDYEAGKMDSLWQFFKTAAFWGPGNRLLKPVIILDQFEEFFALHSQEAREIFTRQLADVVNNTVPAKLVASIPKGEPFPYSDKPPNVKIIISIREDYLGQLEEMAEDIPDILHTRFRLMPLGREQAMEAIVEPSRVKDKKILAASFKLSRDAVDMMLDFLCKRRERHVIKITNEVESFQLQLLCRHMEDKARQKQAKLEGEVVVGTDDLGGETGMQQVLELFYDDQINRLKSEEEKERVCSLFEEGLISKTDRRLSLEEEEIISNFDVQKNLLQELVNRRLLRSEPRVGSIYYELSHDTLVAPIRESQKKRNLRNNSINVLYDEARKLKITQEYEEAAEKYKSIIDIDKTNLNAYLELGQIYHDKREYEEAVKIYNNAIHNNISHALIYYGLGRVFFATGKHGEAIKNYRESLTIDPGLSSAYEGLGDVYENRKEFKIAVENYKKALEIDKEMSHIYIKLAKVHINKGEPDKAIEIYQQALDVSPEYVGIYSKIAETLKMAERGDLIEKIYKMASESGSKDAYHYLKLGDDYKNIKNDSQAIKNYWKAIEIDPDDDDNYYWVGNALYEMKKYNGAIKAFKKAIEIDPKTAYYYHWMGRAFCKLGKYNDAIAVYRKAIEINPDDDNAYLNMGHALCELGKYNDAIALYKKAIEIKPDDIYAYLNMGHAFCKLGKYNDAIVVYKKATEIKPDDSHGYFWMGHALRDLGKYDAAVDEFKKAIKIDPKDAYAFHSMGNTLRELGKYDDSIEAYEKALKVAPESYIVTIKTNLAGAYLTSERFQNADALANEMLKEENISVKYKLVMRFISISSVLFQGEYKKAMNLLNVFIDYYKTIPIDYDRTGDYSEIRDFINSNKKLPPQQTRLLQQMLDLLEAPSAAEELKKLEELETSIRNIFL